MNFRTQIPIQSTQNQISYKSAIVSIGSCFAENMGEKFSYFKFKQNANPFGIIFNPVSINQIINRVVKKEYFTDTDLFFFNERWHCFEVHSDLSNLDKGEMLLELNTLIDNTFNLLKSATHLITTYGTAWVYADNKSESVVANCHKVPQKNFTKLLLSTQQIETSIAEMITLVRSINPSISFIFTVSPVRHSKDGFVENQRSKSNLIVGLNAAVKLDQQHFNYFPSYEILLDELRDYRFYAADMLHPNSIAIDYIWEKFGEAYIDIEAKSLMAEVLAIQRSLQHRSFNPTGIQHQSFLKNLKLKIDQLRAKLPHVLFEQEY